MDTTTLSMIWGLAMLAAVIANSMGWRSWLRTFAPSGVNTGSVDLPGSPEEVSRRIAKTLVAGSQRVSARILEADSRLVRAQLRPVLPSRGGRSSIGTNAGAVLVCHIDRRIEGCRVEYTLDTGELGQSYRTITAALLALGAAAIVVAAVLFPTVVIPSDDPAIRGQTVQVVQLVHFLWPPFLLTYQARRARSMTAEYALDLMANLPYA
jgi:DNA-binding transcriptional ArsR family regulator